MRLFIDLLVIFSLVAGIFYTVNYTHEKNKNNPRSPIFNTSIAVHESTIDISNHASDTCFKIASPLFTETPSFLKGLSCVSDIDTCKAGGYLFCLYEDCNPTNVFDSLELALSAKYITSHIKKK